MGGDGMRGHGGVWLAVFVGGCAGGLARYAETRAWPSGSSGFPTSTLAVNLAGAFLLAAFVTWAQHAGHGRWPWSAPGSAGPIRRSRRSSSTPTGCWPAVAAASRPAIWRPALPAERQL